MKLINLFFITLLIIVTTNRQSIAQETDILDYLPGILAAVSQNTENDGDTYSENEGDCNDKAPAIYPGAIEICGDGIDQDCSGGDLGCSGGVHAVLDISAKEFIDGIITIISFCASFFELFLAVLLIFESFLLKVL